MLIKAVEHGVLTLFCKLFQVNDIESQHAVRRGINRMTEGDGLMRYSRRIQVCLLPMFVGALFLGMLAPVPAQGAEQIYVFIDKLRERGYYDIAVEYMDEMKDSPLADDKYREEYLYEMGKLLVEYARNSSDTKIRDDMYGQAREKLEIYAQGNAGTLGGVKALSELATILVERSRQLAQKAKLPTQEKNKEALLEQTRGLLDEAQKMFENVEEFYRSELKDTTRFPRSINPQTDKKLFDLRQEYRAQFVKTGLDIATVVYEKASTYDPTSEKGKELLTEAAGKFGSLYENYRVWLAGLYARMYQGRCFQDMKDYKTAISYYDELLAQPAEDPVFRTLITKTNIQLAQCLLAQAEDEKKPEKYDELLAKILPWATKPRAAENKTLDFMQLKYYCALAYNERIKTLDEATQKNLITQGKNQGYKLAQEVASSPYSGDYKKPAQEIANELRDREGGSEEPETFAEALEKGKDAVSAMELMKTELKSVPPEKTDEISKLKLEIDALRAEAFQMLRMALTMVDDKVREESKDEIHLVHYYLCYLNWDMERYYDAAVLGEFRARRYPDSGGARPGANIAMAAYLRQYNDPDNRDKDFEEERVVDIAEYITRAWPDRTEADDAHNMLVNFAIQRNKVEEAVQYLEKISADYANRGKTELKVGQEMWRKYLRLSKAEGADRIPPADLEALKEQAMGTLIKGIDRMREKEEVSSTVTAAMYSLAQIYLDTGQIEKAVETLEDDKIGPLTLVQAGNPATNFPGYAEAVYQLALRAYVTVRPARLEDAQRAMDALEAQVKSTGDANSAEKLTQILIGLGRQLQEMMKLAPQEEKQSIASSFEVFLDKISKQEQGNTWASRNWIASTYYDLGSGLEQGKVQSKKSKEYFAKATAAYEKIIVDEESGILKPPSEDSILGVKMRLAECERKTGEYASSLNRLADVLATKPMMLDAQVAAAYTYQERGDREDPKWFRYAYMGGRKDKKTNKNRIWGWYELSQKTRKYPKFVLIFHEARYNLAFARFEYAQSLKGEDRKKYLDYAERDVTSVYKLYPEMGNAEWKEKYDSLLKQIQKELGKKTNGLKAVDEEILATAAAAAAASEKE